MPGRRLRWSFASRSGSTKPATRGQVSGARSSSLPPGQTSYGAFAGGLRNLSTLLLSTSETPVSTNDGIGEDASNA
jgi:hypothetical protein